MGVALRVGVGRAVVVRVGLGAGGGVTREVGTGGFFRAAGVTVTQGEGAMGRLNIMVKSKTFSTPCSQTQSL